MSTAELLAAIGRPDCFPHRPAAVRLVQTHLSIVCLAGELVYKLKKAITLPFVDFAPLAARRRACRDEVRLNRRLCPDVYLGAASLRPGPDGALRFAAIGDDEGPDDVDVAVVMRRLPQERMLDELLAARAVVPAELEALARHVAAFHARTEPVPAAVAARTPGELATFAAANFTELAAIPGHGLPEALLRAVETASAAAFARALPELTERAGAGSVVDGHGDLHARNVCMTEPPAVYDCIEFEPRFRIGDVATEIAFLAMDLRYRGAGDLARVFVLAYAGSRGDDALPALLPPLAAYRAMVRAKVAALATNEAELPAADRDGARTSCRRHVLLAAALLAEHRGPGWLLVCGPPASGKSELCRALTTVAGDDWPVVATDPVRKELAGLRPTERARPEHYTTGFSRRTYTAVLARAQERTRAGAPVVLLDGNFPTVAVRRRAAVAASRCGATLTIVHVAVDAATARARAVARAHDPAAVSDAGADVAAMLHARFTAPTAAERVPLVALDGAQPVDRLVEHVLAAQLAK